MSASAPTCRVIRSVDTFQGRQGLTYQHGVTDVSVGARAICMTVAKLPGGARAKAHLHRGIETAAYVVQGDVEIWFGEKLEHMLEAHTGDYSYIPADMPHVIFNRSDLPCEAVVAHSAANDQEGIVLLPELDALVR